MSDAYSPGPAIIISPRKRFLVLVSLVVGGQLWGTLGAILVIPLAGIVFEFVREFLQRKKERQVVTV